MWEGGEREGIVQVFASNDISFSLAAAGPIHILVRTIKKRGVGNLWTGLGPTLWRDVPFSIIYWSSYETVKHWLHKRTRRKGFLVHFASGASAGFLAASLTTPIDVIKTRRQMHLGAETTQVSLIVASSSLRFIRLHVAHEHKCVVGSKVNVYVVCGVFHALCYE